mgnify:CR=1 FL=1
MHEGQRGLCFVRGVADGEVVLTTYGRSSGFCVDPIEKKPLNHFLPGTPVLSFGTAGCNLTCKFCQNWDISKSREFDKLQEKATPEMIADTFHRACLIAQAVPAGPTFVTAPIELMLQKRVTPFIPAPPRQAPPQVDEATIAEVAKLLYGATHPVVIVESAGRDPANVDALVQIAELLALPVVEAAVPSFPFFPEHRHAINVGRAAILDYMLAKAAFHLEAEELM